MIKHFYQNISGNKNQADSKYRSSISLTSVQLLNSLCLFNSQPLNITYAPAHFFSPTSLEQHSQTVAWGFSSSFLLAFPFFLYESCSDSFYLCKFHSKQLSYFCNTHSKTFLLSKAFLPLPSICLKITMQAA